MSRAFFDVVCPKCNAKMGWFGEYADRPPCRKCGHSLAQDELDAFEARLQKIMEEAAKESEAEDDREWAELDEKAKRLYGEGHAQAVKTRDAAKVSPLKIPSPYLATVSPDGKFHRNEHRLWLWGWRDACNARDRRIE